MSDADYKKALIGILFIIIMVIVFGLFKSSVEKECSQAGYDDAMISIETQPDFAYHVICIKEVREQIK